MLGIALRIGFFAVIILGLMAMGNAYGPNAKRYAKCKANTERIKREVRRVHAVEAELKASEDAERKQADKQFAKLSKDLEVCALTEKQAIALNLIK